MTQPNTPAPPPEERAPSGRTCNCFAVEDDPTSNGHLPTCALHWPSGQTHAPPSADATAGEREDAASIAPASPGAPPGGET